MNFYFFLKVYIYKNFIVLLLGRSDFSVNNKMLEEFLYISMQDCVEKCRYFRFIGIWMKNLKIFNVFICIINRLQFSLDYFVENYMMVYEVYI